MWQVNRRADSSDQSDSESPGKANGSEVGVRRRAPIYKPSAASAHPHHAPEKIKLRFMVDKPEPGAPPASAYKVDLSFSPSSRKTVQSSGIIFSFILFVKSYLSFLA